MTEASIRKKADKKKSQKAKETNIFEIKQHSEFNDLCSTCAGTPTCASRTPGYPVYYCDDHEIYDRIKPKAAESTQTDPTQGLCVNCGNKGNCSHSSAEGGIWNCEEYC